MCAILCVCLFPTLPAPHPCVSTPPKHGPSLSPAPLQISKTDRENVTFWRCTRRGVTEDDEQSDADDGASAIDTSSDASCSGEATPNIELGALCVTHPPQRRVPARVVHLNDSTLSAGTSSRPSPAAARPGRCR